MLCLVFLLASDATKKTKKEKEKRRRTGQVARMCGPICSIISTKKKNSVRNSIFFSFRKR
jgi:hypothetical protein